MVASDPELPQLAPDATHQHLVCALNKLMTRFLDRELADHFDTALSLEFYNTLLVWGLWQLVFLF
jgi:hypothetical protein